MSYTPGLWLFNLSALILTVLITITWQRRNTSSGNAFLFLMFCALIWTLAFSLEIAAQSQELKVLFCKFQFIGITFLPIAWLYLILTYIGNTRPLWNWIVLSIIPATTTLIIWLIPRPNWFWSEPHLVYDIAPFLVMDYDYGFWFYFIHAPYSYLLLFAALYVLIRTIIKIHSIYRYQIIILGVALLLPVITDVFYVLGYSPIQYYNYTPAVFSISCLIIAWALFRYKFLDLLPMARNVVIENMEEGVIVLDLKDRIVDINPSACKITGIAASNIGQPITELSKEIIGSSLNNMINNNTSNIEIKIGSSIERVYDMRRSFIKDRLNQVQGSIVTIRDITEQHSLFKQIQGLAILDDLTGIFNRRYLFEIGQQEINRNKRRRGNIFSIIMMDIDNFKTINDTYGHAVGDQALITLTDRCKNCLRTYDIFGRLGGDEFAFILPDTTLEDAIIVARRVHDHIKQMYITTSQGKIPITASLGVISSQDIDYSDLTFERLLARADEVMFQGKKQGKNQVLSALQNSNFTMDR